MESQVATVATVARASFDVECVDLLSRLVLEKDQVSDSQEALAQVLRFSPQQRTEFVDIANSHHVLVRALSPLAQQAAMSGESELAAWANSAVAAEYARVEHALPY